jgi:excisionase family DNA binding protein
MLTTHEASVYLRLGCRTLERLRLQGTGQKFIKIGKSVRYRETDLQEYVASRVVRSTSETAGAAR